MKKSILIIHYSTYQGERWGRTFPIAMAASNLGYEVTVLTSNLSKGVFAKTILSDKIKIISYSDIIPKIFVKKGWGVISCFRRVIHSAFHKYDYVYTDCGETPCAGFPALIAKYKGAKYLSEWGDLLGKGGYYDVKSKWFKLLIGRYYLWAEQFFRKKANYVLVLSSSMRNHAINIGIDSKKILLFPGGSSINLLLPNYNVKKDSSIIKLGYIGASDSEMKDLSNLVAAILHFKDKCPFKLYLFGEKLSQKVLSQLNCEDVIVECGYINYYNSIELLQEIDIFVLLKSHSLYRNSMGWPNKLGDYMSLGKPVLLNTYGDVSSFVSVYPQGFIVTDNTIQDLVNILISINGNHYDLKEMGKINRLIAEKEISWEKRTKSIFDLIE